MPRHRILQLGAGPLLTQSIRVLLKHGYEVFAVDRNPDAPGFAVASGSAAVDIVDPIAVASYASAIGADLILPVNEPGVRTASLASATLGLPHLPFDIAERCLDKGLMRDCWRAAGLPQPEYRVADRADRIEALARDIGFPCVLKPAQNWGSRGVSFVSSPAELAEAVAFAVENNQSGRYLVEAVLPGVESTIEGLVRDGVPQVLAKSDKEPQPHPRFRVAMALNYPAKFPASVLQRLDDVVGAAAVALGIRNGAFHCECMIDGDDVRLVEMGARGGGGHIFGTIVEAVSGVAMPVALVRILLNQPVDVTPTSQRGCCYRFFAPPPGVFRGVSGIESARELPGILDLGFELTAGTVVGPIASDAARPGFVVGAGATREEAMAATRAAIDSLRWETSPAVVPGG